MFDFSLGWTIAMGAGAVLLLITFLSGFFIVEQQTVRMVTRLGKFRRVAETGPRWKVPFIDGKSAALSLRNEQHEVTVESVTKDNTTVRIKANIQSEVIPSKAFDAFYYAQQPIQQMESFVIHAVRATVPSMDLDEAWRSQDKIAQAIESELTKDMEKFGRKITKTQVLEVNPTDARVLSAMNDITAAQREQQAATARGEANKIITVKNAEAEAEQKKLRGQGVANERKAIAEGIRDSAKIIKDAMGEGMEPQHIMDILLTNQGYDAMRDIGANAKATVVFLPNSAKGLQDLLAASTLGPVVADSVKKTAPAVAATSAQ